MSVEADIIRYAVRGAIRDAFSPIRRLLKIIFWTFLIFISVLFFIGYNEPYVPDHKPSPYQICLHNAKTSKQLDKCFT